MATKPTNAKKPTTQMAAKPVSKAPTVDKKAGKAKPPVEDVPKSKVLAGEALENAIEGTISDLVYDFVVSDRRDDDELGMGSIQRAVAEKIVTVDQMVEMFKTALRDQLNPKKDGEEDDPEDTDDSENVDADDVEDDDEESDDEEDDDSEDGEDDGAGDDED